MRNEQTFDDYINADIRKLKQNTRKNAHQERDSRLGSTEVVSMFKAKLDSKFPP